MGKHVALTLITFGLIAACGGGDDDAQESPVGPIPEYEQRTGDAAAGWRALIEKGYVGCGIPRSAYDQVFGPAPTWAQLDRGGLNAGIQYNFTSFTTTSGVDVIAPNCLQCHAETLRGQVVIGLGNHTADYTDDLSSFAVLAGGLVSDPAERVEYEKFRDRMLAIGPYTMTKTIGVNPADNLAAVLFAHRDNETLAWSNEPILPLPPNIVVPVDVPPWWRMQKKNAMFYDGAGRGDHARIMMTASTLCVDTVAEAQSIDAYFPDVRSYLLTLQPPAWPFAVDTALAATGKDVFDGTCARCHGTYGEGGSYPNLIVALDEVGTDPVLASGAAQFAGEYVRWFNRSFFGELAFLSPAPGYVAPPLDGIWATAPFLHNGSVPTIAALLDSSLRTPYFKRSYDTNAYSEQLMGWPSTAVPAGQDAEPSFDEKVKIYDTSQLGYSNAGHTFGDALTAEQRRAVMEYLKTL
jgi:hypothetical protein